MANTISRAIKTALCDIAIAISPWVLFLMLVHYIHAPFTIDPVGALCNNSNTIFPAMNDAIFGLNAIMCSSRAENATALFIDKERVKHELLGLGKAALESENERVLDYLYCEFNDIITSDGFPHLHNILHNASDLMLYTNGILTNLAAHLSDENSLDSFLCIDNSTASSKFNLESLSILDHAAFYENVCANEFLVDYAAPNLAWSFSYAWVFFPSLLSSLWWLLKWKWWISGMLVILGKTEASGVTRFILLVWYLW